MYVKPDEVDWWLLPGFYRQSNDLTTFDYADVYENYGVINVESEIVTQFYDVRTVASLSSRNIG